jgi:galactoside O-acetyltransferase
LGVHAHFGVGALISGGGNISIGSHFAAHRYSALYADTGKLRISDRVSINSNVCIDACDGGEITIGNDVLIGPNCVLRATGHVFQSLIVPVNQQGHTGGTIVIEDDVWLGANVVVLPNVTIARQSIVAAGAVVTHDVEAGAIVGGVPARVIKRRRL